MISIIYPYRNREPERIKRSLNSLAEQKNKNFEVLFIDYGSKKEIAYEIKKIVEGFSFCTYHYLFSEFQPWNKSKALNFAIRNIHSDYCFVADVDMIFHPEFTGLLEQSSQSDKVIYFQVGFLSADESKKEQPFGNYKINFLSTADATGISLFPVKKLHEIRGFDEFFYFWGAEDTDVHNRLKSVNCEIEFYNKEVLVLHQWHHNYRKRETKTLNLELQLSGIVEFNHLHLLQNLSNKVTQVNDDSWGSSLSEIEFEELQNTPYIEISNRKEQVDYFLFDKLPHSQNQLIAVKIYKDPVIFTLKYKIKKILGKKVPSFYSMKEVNDRILQHVISFYRTKPYIYMINEDLNSIVFKIKF